jgi:hypothetical protein
MFRQCGICCFSIGFWKCSDNVVFFVFLLDFRNVPTVFVGTFPKYNRKTKNTTLSEHFQNPIEKQKIPKCSDNVVFVVFLLDFGNVPTMWYFLFFYCILEMFRQCDIFCFSIGLEKQKIPHCRNISKIQ